MNGPPVTEAAWTLEPVGGPWLWGLLLLAAACVTVTAGWRMRGDRWRRATSVALRLAALAPLVLALAGLSHTTEESHTVRRSVLVVLDGSTSMSVRDGGSSRVAQLEQILADASPMLRRLAEEADLRLWWYGAEPRPLDLDALLPLPAPDGLGTDYLAALEERIAEARPAAVILVGDGADRAALGQTMRGSGADGVSGLARQLAVPIHTLALGGAVDGDLAVDIGDLAPFAFARRPVRLPVRVERDARIGEGEVTLTLHRDGEQVAARTVPLSAEGTGETWFEVVPDTAGYLTLEVRAPTPSDDPIPGNNADARTLRIIRDRTRVLQLASHPSWDVRQLRRLWKTDPNVDLISFFILREAPLLGAYRTSPISLIEFPHEDLFGKDLPGFDLVVLQNFSFDALPGMFGARTSYVENLVRFVEQGGGLLVVGGDRAFADGELGRSALDAVIPVDPGIAGGNGGGPLPLEPTAAGLRHPLMQLAGGADENREAWNSLPALDEVNAVGEARDGAVVLATAADRPVLAVRSVGKGRVMSLASDGSWRWALAGDTHHHATFWRNAVRWLVHDEERGRLELRPQRENLLRGEPVRLVATARGADYAPRVAAELRIAVEPLDGGREPVTLRGITGEDGCWTETVGSLPAGTYRAELAAEDGATQPAFARFTVRAQHPELEEPAARPELLAALSRATGGQHLSSAEGLVSLELSGLERRVTLSRIAVTGWDRWWWLLAAALPLAADWFLRRRWGG